MKLFSKLSVSALFIAGALLSSCSKNDEGNDLTVKSVTIEHHISLSGDMLLVADVEAAYIDPADGQLVRETITRSEWRRTVKAEAFPVAPTMRYSFKVKPDARFTAGSYTFMVVCEVNAESLLTNGSIGDNHSQKFYFSDKGLGGEAAKHYIESLSDIYYLVSVDGNGNFIKRR